ncbi:ssl1498 family light-harvesting-like protein [Pannus brasiliensis CCIBt3594]|uniref:Ssl1498 family light-harvesting-like protein n=1 Tax=Pannus brasiliensis CCIBt3594 TaxID=1427578 RepID=A0AAW9QXJ5_9CHRO
MYTTSDDRGILNNYASEPELYYATYPSPEQQRQYALQGAIATLVVTAFVLVSLAVS